MKKLCSVLIVAAILFAMVPAVSGAETAAVIYENPAFPINGIFVLRSPEKVEMAWDTTYTSTNGLKADVYHLELNPEAEHTLFYFQPGQMGKYTLSVDEGSTIGFWGAASYYIKNPNSTSNIIEREIKADHHTNVIGISSEASQVTLTIYKSGESEGNGQKVYIDYVNEHTPDAKNNYNGSKAIKVNIKEYHTAILGSDGYYHLDAAWGPLLYVDLDTSGFKLKNAYGSYGALSMKGTFGGVDYNFKNAMKEYSDVLNSAGVYPLTVDLYKFLKSYGKNQFWYDETKSPFNDILKGGFDERTAWMVLCRYEPTDNMPTIPEDPVDPTNPTTPDIPTEPTQPTTKPTIPTEPTTKPTQPTTKPTIPTEPTTKPTQPTTKPTIPTEPTTKPTQPTTKPTIPTEPTTKPTQPTTKPTIPTEPTTKPTQPTTKPTTQPTEPALPDTADVAKALDGYYLLLRQDGNVAGLVDFRPVAEGAVNGTLILDLNIFVSGDYIYSYNDGYVSISYPRGQATLMKIDARDPENLEITVNPKLGQVYSLLHAEGGDLIKELETGKNSIEVTVSDGFCPPVPVIFTAPKDGSYVVTAGPNMEVYDRDGRIPFDTEEFLIELKEGESYYFRVNSTDLTDGKKVVELTITEKPSIPDDGPDIPTDPTDPTDPSIPTEPTTKPTIPTEPTTKPTIPTEPTTKPTIPTEPTTKPTIPTDPTTEPTIPVDPTTKPSVPTEPGTTAANTPGDSTGEENVAPTTEPKTPPMHDEPDNTIAVIVVIAVVTALVLVGAAFVILKKRKD